MLCNTCFNLSKRNCADNDDNKYDADVDSDGDDDDDDAGNAVDSDLCNINVDESNDDA